MAWRFRQCPNCKEVLESGELSWEGGEGWFAGQAIRRCPLCRYEGMTKTFPVVYDQGRRLPSDPKAAFAERKRQAAKRWVPLPRLRAAVVARMKEMGMEWQ